MATTSAICTSWKGEVLAGTHTSSDVYKLALFTSAATLSASTTAYSATDEVVGTGYTAGGATLSGITIGTSGTNGYLTWADPTWPTSTITARGFMVYNSSKGNKAVMVGDFGGDITTTVATFTVDLPAAGASALIVI